jgi:amino-acid N-acetyltransferase
VKLTDLRGILQYIPQFREKTFIIAVDGVIVTDEIRADEIPRFW